MIQAASFRNDKDADRMRADLILSGMDTNIRKTIGKNGKPWYRVVIGPFVSRSKMNRAKDKLANKDIQAYSYKIPKEE
jgi:cell division protein FtsN